MGHTKVELFLGYRYDFENGFQDFLLVLVLILTHLVDGLLVLFLVFLEQIAPPQTQVMLPLLLEHDFTPEDCRL